MSKYQVGSKVQLSATYIKKTSKFDPPHSAAFKAGAGTGTVTEVYPNGSLAITWEKDFFSMVMPARNVKRAR